MSKTQYIEKPFDKSKSLPTAEETEKLQSDSKKKELHATDHTPYFIQEEDTETLITIEKVPSEEAFNSIEPVEIVTAENEVAAPPTLLNPRTKKNNQNDTMMVQEDL